MDQEIKGARKQKRGKMATTTFEMGGGRSNHSELEFQNDDRVEMNP